METIYKGAVWSMTVRTDTELDQDHCVLYNVATDTTIPFLVERNGTQDGLITYTLTLTADDTESESVGVYNLELYAQSNGAMLHYQEAFARLIQTSKHA